MKDVYPIGPDEPLTEKTYLMLNWRIGDATNPEDVVLCRILNLILLGNEAAPLRKAIVDSGLGVDIYDNYWTPAGASVTGPHHTFHIGLTGSEADHVDAFTELVIRTLAHIADAEIDQDQVEAAFQQITYDYQEITPSFPFRMMERVVNTWIYEKEPTRFLEMGKVLSTIHQRWAQNPRIFNELIREKFLNNPHRLTVVFAPDPGMQARLDAADQARLKAIRAQLTDEQMREIAAAAAELERRSGQPNSPEDLAKLPQLRVSDLPEKPLHISTSVETVSGCPLLRSDVFSNGVNYLTLNLDLQGLPQHLWQYLPRYTDAIAKLGAGEMDYEQMARRTAAATGGLSCSPNFSTHVLNPDEPVRNIQFQIKMLDDKMEDALNVLQDLIFAVNPRDTGRLRDVLSQSVAEYRTYIHGYQCLGIANRRAVRGLSPHGYLSEIVSGTTQFRASDMLLKRFDESHEQLSDSIEQIRDFLLVRSRVSASFTGSDAAFETLNRKLAEWIDSMRDEPINPEPVAFEPFDVYPREGLATPIQIANCTHVIPAPHYSHPDSIPLTIGAHILGLDYMMTEIRLKGNAYLGIFEYNPFDAVLYQGSGFDPHVARSLNVFEQTANHVKQVKWTQADIDRGIIGAAADYQKAVRPSQAATDALSHYLTGQTREMFEERYDRLQRATSQEVKRALLQVLEENRDKASICVVASREKLETENQKMAQPLQIEDIFK